MTAVEHHPLPGSLSAKITVPHLQRWACIYVRQSTHKQVAQNRESQANQYQLAQRAQELGWAPERIRIIDADLGLSGQSSVQRTGFQELVTEISLGHVGVVFGYEVSRLARNNSDWYHLLDLAAVFGTLIADHDGVYEPRLYNDRLLLGLKGTMSEAELHLLRLRLEGGRMSQVRRGEYRQHLPTGLLRLPDGQVVKDPDDQVRHTIELVFETFATLGSARQVLQYFVQHELLLPRRQTAGFHKGELLWKRPSDAAVYDILRNPAYAGAFVYGRCQVDHTRQQPGHPTSGRLKRPMEEWTHIQRDVYPAYITWEQYLANRERLQQNATHYRELKGHGTPGPAREGSALLQGLATCGCCGHRMAVAYKGSPRYLCGALTKHFGGAMCMSLHGPSVDEVVVQAFFRAIQPAQLDALDAILAEQREEQQRLVRQWEERLQRARYEGHLAERQYHAVDPDNRLVAAELERRWEQKLRHVQETEEAYRRFQNGLPSPQLTEEMREQFRHISDSLPSLWQSGQLSNSQKKELLRTLILRVVLNRMAPDTVEVKIVWVSGHYSVDYAHPPIHRERDVTNYDGMVARIRALWEEGHDDEQIAVQLTSEGFRSARSVGVSPVAVRKIRLRQGWYHSLHRSRNALELDGYLTVAGLARQLGMDRAKVYRHLSRGEIDPQYISRHPQSNVYLICNDPQVVEQIRSLLLKT